MLCFIVGFALLTGNPISGALLRSPHYEWTNPILFASVSRLCLCLRLCLSEEYELLMHTFLALSLSISLCTVPARVGGVVR